MLYLQKLQRQLELLFHHVILQVFLEELEVARMLVNDLDFAIHSEQRVSLQDIYQFLPKLVVGFFLNENGFTHGGCAKQFAM